MSAGEELIYLKFHGFIELILFITLLLDSFSTDGSERKLLEKTLSSKHRCPPAILISTPVPEMNPPSLGTDTDLERFRRFRPGGTLSSIPNAKFLSEVEVRGMFNIPKSVKFTKMENLTDPICKDEVVVNLYQLACGLTMPVDSFTCALLNAWGISINQMHPSLCLVLQRVRSISKAYHLLYCQ